MGLAAMKSSNTGRKWDIPHEAVLLHRMGLCQAYRLDHIDHIDVDALSPVHHRRMYTVPTVRFTSAVSVGHSHILPSKHGSLQGCGTRIIRCMILDCAIIVLRLRCL